MNKQEYLKYFDNLGYKTSNPRHYKLIVTDFQRHTFPNNRREWDGIIGPKTQSKIDYYNRDNFCPEVYEPILDNRENIDCYDMEKYLLRYKLCGLSWAFLDTSCVYNSNILHIIAHAILESNWGRSKIAIRKRNLFGFRAYDSSPYVSAGKFKSYSACIMEWAGWWKEKYLEITGKYYNGNNEKGVNVKYASSPIAGINKAFIVQNLRKKLMI